MSFDNSSKGYRPTTFWNNFEGDLNRNLTPMHDHEFGPGYDIQYTDSSGKIQGEMHGLTISETQYLSSIKDKW